MAVVADFCPDIVDICVTRGDSPVMFFTVNGSGSSNPDITGFTFTMTVGPSPEPSDDSGQLFQISGVIVDGPNGRWSVQPSTSNTDLSPGVYFYDVQMTTLTPSVRTILAGKFTVKQDLTKT